MKIGINLVGVSYNNAKEGGRLRDYENSIQNFYTNVVNPLRQDGHEVKFYLFSYKNEKQDNSINNSENYECCNKLETFLSAAAEVS